MTIKIKKEKNIPEKPLNKPTMKTKNLYLLSILIGLLIIHAFPGSATSMPSVCVPPACDMERPFIIDKSIYALPNGMQFDQAMNLQQNGSDPSAPVFRSATTFGLTGTTQIGQLAVDASGNRYVTGGFTGTIGYGDTVVESSGGYDFFLAKLSPEGDLLWYRIAHGNAAMNEDFSLEGGLTLALDPAGNIYVGGAFVKELNFTDGNGETVKTLTDGRDDDLINLEMFVAKYNAQGSLLWALGGESGSPAAENSLATGINVVNSIMIDLEGYPYIAGSFSGTNFLGEEVTVVGGSDFFMASLDKNGNYMYWFDVFGTPDNDLATAISVDGLGYLNVLGVVGEGRMYLPDSDIYWDNDTGDRDTFVISYDVNGEWYFASFMGAGDQIVGQTIVSVEDGSFFVGGYFSGEGYFEGSNEIFEAYGSEDGFIVKYDIDGDMIWVRHFGFSVAAVDVVTLDENEDVIVLGRFTDAIIFEAESDNPVILTTDSFVNIFVAKYDKDGNFMWAKNIEGTGAESADVIFDRETRPFGTNPLDIVLSAYNGGEMILVGDYDATLNLDDIVLTSDGDRRVFFGVMTAPEPVSVRDDINLASGFQLMQNYPNPFNPSTSISFSLPEASQVNIEVFSITGQKVGTVTNEMFTAGQHTLSWYAAGLASGTYIYRLTADNFTQSRKMTLVK